jgi:cysteine-rich repeat protein
VGTGGGGTGGGGGAAPACGNGDSDPGEECDDGNTDPGDRCGPTCLVEHPDDCPGTPIEVGPEQIIVSDTTVGANDTIDTLETGVGYCSNPGTFFAPDLIYAITPTGPGTLTVELEAGYGEHWLHLRQACGNTGAIGCDFGNTPAETDVIEVEVIEGSTYYAVVDGWNDAAGPFELRIQLHRCGDGVVTLDEECDDGNAVDDGNGCSADCQVECDPCGGAGCSDFEDPSTHHCYVNYTDGLPWNLALAACRALGAGWDLAAISSEAERAFIEAQALPANAWIGGTDEANEDTFVWTNGEPWWDGGWAPGEPGGDANENCVVYYLAHDPDGFEERDCAQTRDYLCELAPAGI